MCRLVALLAALAIAPSAAAQEHNPQAFPVGEEALGLGGAYTGRASDASATYYNPAGLVFGRAGALSASLSLGLVDRYVLDGARDDFALEFDDAFGVPFYVGASAQVGDAFPDGGLRHAIAASTLTPSNSRRRFVFERMDSTGITSLRVRRQDVTHWYGLSYAVRPVEQLGLGLTLFLTTRSFAHEEQEIAIQDGRELAVRSTRAEMGSEHLVLRLGVLFQIDPNISLGLMIQPPSIEIGSRATIGSVRATSDAGGVASTFDREERIGARSPIPWQARLGVAWTPVRELVLTADVMLVGPIGSATEPVVRFEPARPLAPGAAGNYLATEWWSDWTVDTAVGARILVADRVPIALGFFTALSSAPDILDGTTDVYQPDQLDIFGAALNAGYHGEGFELTVGLVGTLGFGRGLRAISPVGPGPMVYEPVGLNSQTLYLFITGAGGAIEAVGRTLVEQIDWLSSDPSPSEGAESEGAESEGAESEGAGSEGAEGESDPREQAPRRRNE